jgi:hypothetical protein
MTLEEKIFRYFKLYRKQIKNGSYNSYSNICYLIIKRMPDEMLQLFLTCPNLISHLLFGCRLN